MAAKEITNFCRDGKQAAFARLYQVNVVMVTVCTNIYTRKETLLRT